MFSSQKRQPVGASRKKSTTGRDSAVTILTSGCHFEGKLYCKGASRVGGKIQGQIISEGLLIIEEEARVQADVVVDEVIVLGHVSGKLRATKRIELCAGSVFQGDIASPVLVIKEGAKFNGRSATTEEKDAEITTDASASIEYRSSEPELNPSDVQSSGGKMPDVTIVNNLG